VNALLDMLPEVIEGTYLESFVPGASNIGEELARFRKSAVAADPMFGPTMEVNLTKAHDAMMAHPAMMQVNAALRKMVAPKDRAEKEVEEAEEDADGEIELTHLLDTEVDSSEALSQKDSASSQKDRTMKMFDARAAADSTMTKKWVGKSAADKSANGCDKKHAEGKPCGATGASCTTMYLWNENNIAIEVGVPGERFKAASVWLDWETCYYGGVLGRVACGYSSRARLYLPECNPKESHWRIISFKWSYTLPDMKCPLERELDPVKPTKSGITLYFGSGCPGPDRDAWGVPYFTGMGLDLRPQCLIAKGLGPDYPEAKVQRFIPQIGWGVTMWGNVLKDIYSGYCGTWRVTYRNPHIPKFYSYVVVFQAKVTLKPSGWLVALGHRHGWPVYRKDID